MDILFLNHNVAGQGTFQRAFGFARHLALRGHSVTLLTTSPHNRFKHTVTLRNGVRVVEAPDLMSGKARSGWDAWDTLWRIGYLRNKRFDLIHAFDSRPSVIFPALSAKRWLCCPLILDWCDWWGRGGTIKERSGWLIRNGFGPIETFFEEAFRGRADGTTVISAALYDRALGLGVSSDRMLRLLNGADLDKVSPLPRMDARARLGLPADQPIIGYLGVLNRSDAALLYDAFQIVRSRQPECRLLLIGRHTSQVPPALRDAVIESGYVSAADLSHYLAACDLFALTMKNTLASRARWPGKIGDYLAAGRPIVATAVGEAELLLRGCPSVSLTDDRPQELADAILRWIDRRHDLNGLCDQARELAESKLSWNELTGRLESFYTKIGYRERLAAGLSERPRPQHLGIEE